MAGYQRKTVSTPGEILELAERVLPSILGVAKTKSTGHGATFSGEEGTVTLNAHRHGMYTEVIASTDRLRTSRLDYEVQRFLNQLPYEHGDAGGPGSSEPN